MDEATHSKILSDAAKEWNRRAGKNVPQFAQLPGGWQTVIRSRFFQQGPAFTKQSPGQTFFSQAVAGDWKAAMATFDGYANHGSFGQYRDRLDAEGKLLHAEIPATPTPTTTPAGAR